MQANNQDDISPHFHADGELSFPLIFDLFSTSFLEEGLIEMLEAMLGYRFRLESLSCGRLVEE